MNLLDRLKAAWKKHDEELAESALHAPEEDLYTPLEPTTDEQVSRHEHDGEND